MGKSAEAWGRENESGMNDCEEWDYHHAEVCVYCGNRKGEKLSCCNEVHFDTQFNIDHRVGL